MIREQGTPAMQPRDRVLHRAKNFKEPIMWKILQGALKAFNLFMEADRDKALREDGARTVKSGINDKRDEVRQDAKEYREKNRNRSDDDIVSKL